MNSSQLCGIIIGLLAAISLTDDTLRLIKLLLVTLLGQHGVWIPREAVLILVLVDDASAEVEQVTLRLAHETLELVTSALVAN